MKIIKTASYKKLKADVDPYDESYEEWSPEKEKGKYNDAGKDAVLNYMKKEILPDVRQKHEEQIKPRPGETLELYMQRRIYIIQNRINELIRIDAVQPIIDNEHRQLEKVKEEGPGIYHNFKMDEAQRKNI
jgi:alpha-amylase/alpha-mannosidase (GH57 family)